MSQTTQRSELPLGSAIIGAFFVLVSAPCVISSVYDIVTGTSNMTGAIVAGSFFAILLFIGVGLFGWGFKNRNTATSNASAMSASMERSALQVMSRLEGEVTVAQLALHTDLSVRQATNFLDDLVEKGIAQSWVTDEGALSYRIPHLGDEHSEDAEEFVFESAEDAVEKKAIVERSVKHILTDSD